MTLFRYQGLPTRVLFGSGTFSALAEECAAMGLERLLLLTTPQQTGLGDRAKALLGDRAVGLFTDATMHTPVEVTERALATLRAVGADGIVALGGGSTIGLGKALALRTDLPQIVVATTYAGSEMTPILGQTDNGLKTTQRGPKIQPECAIYDVDLTLSLPAAASVASGLNAVAHAVEALYAADGNPIVTLMAQEGIRAMTAALPGILADPADREARHGALYGAWLCGSCLGQVSMGLHHKLCHVLGGSFDLPHAETHSIILPHAVAYNRVAGQAMNQLSQALGTDETPWTALHHLARNLGAPIALRDLGMPESGIAKAVEIACSAAYPNPRPLARAPLEQLLRNAWAGAAPAEY
ncbi:MAG: Maleylacetate reductase [Rhizorhabdus sp.]|nr:Maleylacetate reductase [Rhizorhabdus sp.]